MEKEKKEWNLEEETIINASSDSTADVIFDVETSSTTDSKLGDTSCVSGNGNSCSIHDTNVDDTKSHGIHYFE